MIDMIALFVPHLAMSIAVWRLLRRDDLDHDPALPSPRRGGRRR